jgi:sensor histidine kinase YesM
LQNRSQKGFSYNRKFGTYLRNNIDSLDQPELIPLEKEIEHTKIYAEIEMIRFPKINVEYKIEEKNFSIPALTIQPLVENAIRHGVRNREHGLVTVETKENEDNYEIIISDNGVGFDTETLKENDGSHIGLSNVKERIEKMCDGTFDIDSRINEGTKITITIPRNEE